MEFTEAIWPFLPICQRSNRHFFDEHLANLERLVSALRFSRLFSPFQDTRRFERLVSALGFSMSALGAL